MQQGSRRRTIEFVFRWSPKRWARHRFLSHRPRIGGEDATARSPLNYTSPQASSPLMHYDAHQPIIDDLEARITTIRDSL